MHRPRRGSPAPAGLAAVAAIALGWPAAPARAALSTFLKFEAPSPGAKPVQGESTDAAFAGGNGWIAVDSFDLGPRNSVSSGKAGKTTFEPVVVSKDVDVSSPALFDTLVRGASYGKARLVLVQDGATARSPFYHATLSPVYVGTVKWTGSAGDDKARESLELVHGAIDWSYVRFDATGAMVTTLQVNWSQLLNMSSTPEKPMTPVLGYPPGVALLAGDGTVVSPATGPSGVTGLRQLRVLNTGGFAGGISTDPATGRVTLTGANPVGGPYAVVLEASDYLGGIRVAGFSVTVGQVLPPPAANPDRFDRVLGTPLELPVAGLLSNDSAGAAFDGLPSAATSNGGRVTLAGSVVLYAPPVPDPGTLDTFGYRVRDAAGRVAMGLVTVGIAGPGGAPRGNLEVRTDANGVGLTLSGVPGQRYQLETASDASGPWTPFGDPVVANGDGLIGWNDTNAEVTRFYRATPAP